MRKILFILFLFVSSVSYGQSVKSDSTVVYEYHFKIDTSKKKAQNTKLELEIEHLKKLIEHMSEIDKLRNDMKKYEGRKEYQKLNEDFKRLENISERIINCALF